MSTEHHLIPGKLYTSEHQWVWYTNRARVYKHDKDKLLMFLGEGEKCEDHDFTLLLWFLMPDGIPRFCVIARKATNLFVRVETDKC